MTSVFVCEKCGTSVRSELSSLARVKRCMTCARKAAAIELDSAVRNSRFRREALRRLELFQTDVEKAAPERADRREAALSVAELRGTISRVLARSMASG